MDLLLNIEKGYPSKFNLFNKGISRSYTPRFRIDILGGRKKYLLIELDVLDSSFSFFFPVILTDSLVRQKINFLKSFLPWKKIF